MQEQIVDAGDARHFPPQDLKDSPDAIAQDVENKVPRQRRWYQMLGPGLITGASDDDPSGIATYAQAGAMFAYAMLWTLVLTLPLMAATQELSARIGRVSGRGLAGNMRRCYGRWLVLPIVFLLVAANVINLGADIAAMGQSAQMLMRHGSPLLYAAAFAVLSLVLQVFIRYAQYTQYLKWLSLVLVVYIATAFLGHVHWKQAMWGAVFPHVAWTGGYLSMLVAVIGTTISPYLFFWQASMETEEIKSTPNDNRLKKSPEQARDQFERIRIDTYAGMGISNLIGFFIMLTFAVTIGSDPNGNHQINSAQDAAAALGQALHVSGHGMVAQWLFCIGVIGTGMLAVPVLAGSAAYGVSEAMNWGVGLDRKIHRARGFYAVLAAATLLGLGINFVHAIDPIQALVWSAVINGVVAVPVMAVMVHMSADPRIMGKFANVGKGVRAFGWLATGIMLLAAIGMFATWGK
ncbi:MAG: divalent metal cation transporter [Planctomycetota bacterium]|nr:divalent metal cation transporter [Planctomycetota bacterium]